MLSYTSLVVTRRFWVAIYFFNHSAKNSLLILGRIVVYALKERISKEAF